MAEKDIVVVPFNFGADKPNGAVAVAGKNIAVIYQTVRDDNLYDAIYRGKLLTRIVKLGLEILVDEAPSAIVDRWDGSTEAKIARFTRLPTAYAGDETVVAVNAASVTDVRPIPPGIYDVGYSSLIVLGGLRVPVTEDIGLVKARLGWNV